jgi:hypothetical protein
MGASVIITGLSSEIALTLVTIGVDLSKVNAVGDLQGGIEEAERLLGYQVTRSAVAEPHRRGSRSSRSTTARASRTCHRRWKTVTRRAGGWASGCRARADSSTSSTSSAGRPGHDRDDAQVDGAARWLTSARPVAVVPAVPSRSSGPSPDVRSPASRDRAMFRWPSAVPVVSSSPQSTAWATAPRRPMPRCAPVSRSRPIPGRRWTELTTTWPAPQIAEWIVARHARPNDDALALVARRR